MLIGIVYYIAKQTDNRFARSIPLTIILHTFSLFKKINGKESQGSLFFALFIFFVVYSLCSLFILTIMVYMQ